MTKMSDEKIRQIFKETNEDLSQFYIDRMSTDWIKHFSEDLESSRALDIRIMRLRKKIEPDPASPRFLKTVRGEGYVFSLPGGESR